MFLRLFFVLLLVFWVVPLVKRFMTRSRRPLPDASAPRRRPERDDHLANLTRQDISDAEYEDLPPEK